VSTPLDYPIGSRPEAGSTIEVKPGVLWVRMPIPIPGLDTINLWLLADGEGWTLVDTGLKHKPIKEHWETIFARHLGGKPVTRIVATHMHPDHIGQAGWLTERFGCRLWITQREWLFARMLSLDSLPEPPETAVAFYRRLGFDEAALAEFRSWGYGNFARGVTPIPTSFRRIRDGEEIAIGGRRWRVIVGEGHSPEHACLHSPELGLLISGDQVLPKISPHIGVYPSEPEMNPLGDYLASLPRLKVVPDETLVLPSHGDPFLGLHRRLDALSHHHDARLEALAAACAEPRVLVDVLPVLFKRELNARSRFMAAHEALAHVNLLIARGQVERVTGADGVLRFRATSRSEAAA